MRAKRCSAARCAPSSSRRRPTLERAGVAVDDVDWFVPHQANVRIIEAAAQAARDPAGAHAREHRPLRQHVGGVDPARARRGGRRRPRRTTATSCCCSGFGAGMTWASALAALGPRVSDAGRRSRVAFVTGGVARHRPRDRASRSARPGHPVAFCYSSDDDGAEETLRRGRGRGRRGARRRRPTSPTPTRSTPRSARSRARSARSTVLVNNAGDHRATGSSSA